KYKAECDLQREWYKAECDSKLEEWKLKFRATVQSGQAALKSAFLINGGAAVGLLAFIGNVWTKTKANVNGLGFPLLLYVFGVLFPAVASGLTYLSQYQYGKSVKDDDHFARCARKINWVGITFVILSYFLFAIATFWAYRFFVAYQQVVNEAL
ncbi:unnamed protein product, partial [marine sediment metagenome]